jgi:hypothetical protein
MSIEAMKQWLAAIERANEIDGMYSWKSEEDSLRQAIAEAEKQEPVGEIINERGDVDYISYVPPIGTNLYTHSQPKREWKWLTDEETQTCWDKAVNTIAPQYSIVRAIEAKLKQKNGFAEEKNT